MHTRHVTSCVCVWSDVEDPLLLTATYNRNKRWTGRQPISGSMWSHHSEQGEKKHIGLRVI